jgi:hypothetical protein
MPALLAIRQFARDDEYSDEYIEAPGQGLAVWHGVVREAGRGTWPAINVPQDQ